MASGRLIRRGAALALAAALLAGPGGAPAGAAPRYALDAYRVGPAAPAAEAPLVRAPAPAPDPLLAQVLTIGLAPIPAAGPAVGYALIGEPERGLALGLGQGAALTLGGLAGIVLGMQYLAPAPTGWEDPTTLKGGANGFVLGYLLTAYTYAALCALDIGGRARREAPPTPR